MPLVRGTKKDMPSDAERDKAKRALLEMRADVARAVPFVYRAKVERVYDGDTIYVTLDYGRKIYQSGVKVRLYGINAPELHGEEKPLGIKSRDWLAVQVSGKDIVLQTIKDKEGKYGRLLGIIWIDGRCLNEEMLELGLASEFLG